MYLLSVFLRDHAERMVRLHVVALRLAFGEFHLLAGDFLVGDQALQVGNAVQSPSPLIMRSTTYQGDSGVSVAANIASRARE